MYIYYNSTYFRHFHFQSYSHHLPICIHKDYSAGPADLAVAYNPCPSGGCNQSSGASCHNQSAEAAFRLAEIAYLAHRYILVISLTLAEKGGLTSSKRPQRIVLARTLRLLFFRFPEIVLLHRGKDV